jgi:hypothetical protein
MVEKGFRVGPQFDACGQVQVRGTCGIEVEEVVYNNKILAGKDLKRYLYR